MDRHLRQFSAMRSPVWRSRRPLFTIGLIAFMAVGAALFLPITVSVIAALVLIVVCPLPPLRRIWWILLAAAVLMLSTAGHRHRQEVPLRPLAEQTAAVTAQVVDLPRSGYMYTVRVTDSDRIPAGTRLSLYCAPGSEPLLYDTVSGTVTLKEVPRSSAYRWSQRTFLYAFPAGEWNAAVQVVGHPSPPSLYALQQYFSHVLRQALPDDEGALLAALCLGDRHAVSITTSNAFRNSGLSHLLVVSGLHLSMLAVALYTLLRRIGVGYRLSAGLTLPFVWVFAGMIGGTSSVLRAATMCSLWLVSFMVYRRYDGLNAWGLAASLLLMADPYRLLHAGFQLSFAATAGVLILAPRLCRPRHRTVPAEKAIGRLWQRLCRTIRNGGGVCAAALLFTLPLSVFYYHGLSLTALPANLLAVIPAGWALTVGWLGLLCGTLPILRWISRPLLYTAGWLARYLQGVAALCGPDGAFAPLPHPWQKWLVCAVCGILICAIVCRIPWRRVLAVTLTLTITASAVGIPLSATPRLTVIGCGTHAALLINHRGHTSLLTDHSATLAELSYTLSRQGVIRLDSLFIGDGSTEDGGTLRHLWEQYGQPAVFTAEDGWCDGVDVPTSLCGAEDGWTLWEGGDLTLLPHGWWHLDVGGGMLFATDPAAPRPQAAALTVYAAPPEASPADGYCILSCRRGTSPQPITDQTLFLTDASVTLTARRGGEWSVSPWL